MKVFLSVVLAGALLMQITLADSFKKITLTSNNAPYFLYPGDGVFAQNDSAYLKTLREYVSKHGFVGDEKSEALYVESALKWVNEQWQHDGMNEPPSKSNALDILHLVYDKKEKFRCVEFGLVLSEVLQSYGFVTRSIGMRSSNVAYGGFGQGHVAMEVWLNQPGKWVFLDGQFGVFITRAKEDTPLNYYEIYQERIAGHWKDLKIHFVQKTETEAQDSKDYKSFLNEYFGHMTLGTSKSTGARIALNLENKKTPATMQGGADNNQIFTQDPKLIYPEINRVSLLLSYADDDVDFAALMDKLQIKTNEDYLKHMKEFAVKPIYNAKLLNNMPSFSHYEFRFGSSGEWTKIKDSILKWDAIKPENRLEVRAVNQFGRVGPATWIDVTYK